MRLLLYILIFSAALRAQNNLRIYTADGVLMKVLKDEKTVNTLPEASVLIENVEEDTLRLKIEFENKSRYGAVVYLLEKGKPVSGKEFEYRVTLEKNKLQVQFMAIKDARTLPQPLVPPKPVLDTSQKYRNTTLGHFCELHDGKPVFFNNLPHNGSCVTAMPSEYLNYTALLMKKTQVTDEKVAVADNIARNNCLTVVQLKVLLGYVDFEIEKLKLVRTAYFHLTDFSNQKQLEESFRFESSIGELKTFLANPGEYRVQAGAGCDRASDEKEITTFADQLAAFNNDAQRLEAFKKSYSNHCYSIQHSKMILGKFIHDREKITAARMLYFNCSEKEKFGSISEVFSYNQSAAELDDFIKKQEH